MMAAAQSAEYDELLKVDAEFGPQYARHYILTSDEADKLYSVLGTSGTPTARWVLHTMMAVFVEDAIREVEGLTADKLVQSALTKVALYDPEGFMGEIGAEVAAAIEQGLQKPNPQDAKEIFSYVRTLAGRAEALLQEIKPRTGRPVDTNLDDLLFALVELAAEMGASPSVGNNESLRDGDTPPPFLFFVEEVLHAACERGEMVVRARPGLQSQDECLQYFSRVKALALGGARRLADAVRRADKRQKSLLLQ